jgi:hypothetical protein
MQSKLVTIGDLDLELGLNFGAAREISQKVGDILGIAREAALEGMLMQSGIVHSPKWMPTIDNVPMIFWLGAKHGGNAVKLEAVQEAVFQHGFIEAKEIALGYLAALATPLGREKVDDLAEGDAKPGE